MPTEPAPTARTTPFRVALADDDTGVRSALAGLLGDDPRIDLRGAFADGHELRALCRREHLDLTLIDVAMPGGGPELAHAIHEASPDTVVAVYTAHGDRRTRAAMLSAGAAAFLEKGRTADVTAALLDLLNPAASTT